MEMFLIILLTGVLATVLLGLMAAGLRMRPAAETRPVVVIDPRAGAEATQFFADAGVPAAPQRGFPAELLRSRLERHVLLEQAAAESFIDLPSSASLHTRTTSSFLN